MQKVLKNFVFVLCLAALTSCGYLRVDFNHVLLRSDKITSLEQEREILSRARLDNTADGKLRVLYLAGTPYEIGYQQGVLLRSEIQDNLGYLYKQSVKTFHSEELFAEVYDRMRPYIPEEYVEEMRGLAHGSQMPLHVIHAIHVLPEMTEWGGKKKLKAIVKQMIAGDLGTSCSNICAADSATPDGAMLTVRILDWGLHRISKLHQYPLLVVVKPDKGVPYLNITWVGFLGAISGMNAEGITLGEMGNGDPEGETLSGKPMPFLLRDVIKYAKNLDQARKIIKDSPGTNSFAFLISDGKSKKSELYIKDATRFLVFKPGQALTDGEKTFPGIGSINYAGHFDDKLYETLTANKGVITKDLLIEKIIPYVAMKSNFQNVIYDPKLLQIWVSYSPGPGARAAEQEYTHFDLLKAFASFGTSP